MEEERSAETWIIIDGSCRIRIDKELAQVLGFVKAKQRRK